MEWHQVFERVQQHVVRIETPSGQGTGYFCLFNAEKTFVGVATASHVVEHAHTWNEPIRIVQGEKHVLLNVNQRVILIDESKDSAVVMMKQPPQAELVIPQNLIPLIPNTKFLKIGTEVGWIGYPYIEGGGRCCFFSGKISSRDPEARSYFIDGVAINGVSGAPVVHKANGTIRIVGSITAYIVNRATGESLPGLSVAHHVSHLHKTAEMIKNIDESRKSE